MKTIRIGTRGSKLALIQAETVKKSLLNIQPDLTIEIHPIKTSGDILLDRPLDEIGGKGVFVKDIEKRLIANEVDIAVHSLKDMPALLPDELMIAAFLEREDPRDMLFSVNNKSLKNLPNKVRIGTSSLRRKCQIKNVRPDAQLVDIRGNVPTRLKKVGKDLDAVILAAAGIKRLGLSSGILIPTETMIPSPGQGVIAVETRKNDLEIISLVQKLDDPPTRICAETERLFLATLGADCHFPVAAYARLEGSEIILTGMIGKLDDFSMVKTTIRGKGLSLGKNLAEKLLENLAKENR